MNQSSTVVNYSMALKNYYQNLYEEYSVWKTLCFILTLNTIYGAIIVLHILA